MHTSISHCKCQICTKRVSRTEPDCESAFAIDRYEWIRRESIEIYTIELNKSNDTSFRIYNYNMCVRVCEDMTILVNVWDICSFSKYEKLSYQIDIQIWCSSISDLENLWFFISLDNFAIYSDDTPRKLTIRLVFTFYYVRSYMKRITGSSVFRQCFHLLAFLR